MRLHFTILLLIFSLQGKAQQIKRDSIVNTLLNKLKKKGIDTIGLIERHCEYMRPEKCRSSTFYILRKIKNRTYVRKLNECGKSKVKIVRNNYFFDFYFENADVIAKNKVKPFTLQNGAILTKFHYCTRRVWVHTKDSEIKFEINFHDLSKGYDTNLNIYEESNNALPQVLWIRNTDEIIDKLLR